MERTLYNGFLAGLSLDGQRYIYANPLQVRDGHLSTGDDGDYLRVAWFRCACCPPNVMRLIASLEHYVLLSSDDTVTLHQYMSGLYGAQLAGGETRLEVGTDYPWDGAVQVGVAAAPGGVWTLALRVPVWAEGVYLSVNGEPVLEPPVEGWWRVTRDWEAGDVAQLDLPLEPRLTAADPRVDAARGCLAIERGPLVYCLEGVDHKGHRLDDLVLDASVPLTTSTEDGDLGHLVRVQATGATRPHAQDSWWPYGHAAAEAAAREPVALSALPYFTWGNRTEGAMRVWVPTT